MQSVGKEIKKRSWWVVGARAGFGGSEARPTTRPPEPPVPQAKLNKVNQDIEEERSKAEAERERREAEAQEARDRARQAEMEQRKVEQAEHEAKEREAEKERQALQRALVHSAGYVKGMHNRGSTTYH